MHAVDWQADGVPRSTHYDDVYRSHHGTQDLGLRQSREVFLAGCGLIGEQALWRHQAHWHILETGFGLGLNFLSTWWAWQQDPQRPARLSYSAVELHPVQAQDLLRSVAAFEPLLPLAQQLAAQWRGLLPGLHRLVFEGGALQLTLAIGDAPVALREFDSAVDSVFLDGFSPEVNPQMWALPTLKAVARLARSGTGLATWCVRRTLREDLQQCGFASERLPGVPPKQHRLVARFAPAWTPRQRPRLPLVQGPDRRALVLGAGLSGAAVACSLAKRGWQVEVLDAGDGPGAGASGLPVGLTAPHVSPDDNPLSRITRAGVRATMGRAQDMLAPGDWQASGVLEHRVEGKHRLGQDWPEAGADWSRNATPEECLAAGLPADTPALWHRMAAWLRPRALVKAQLATPGVAVRWGASVKALQHEAGRWQVLDAQGRVLGEAPWLVLASGFDSRALLENLSLKPALHPLRGQVSLGRVNDLPEALRAGLPAMPVNGHGSFISGMPLLDEWGDAPGWCLGATFERAQPQALLRDEDHAANHARLGRLLPGLSGPMQAAFAPQTVRAWAGLRCTVPDRLPMVGAVAPDPWPGLWMCAGMGARGISLSVLCGELIAAQLEGEPLPLSPSLALRLAASRPGAQQA